ncbi:endolytic transglycosylase MltG [Kyrpidia tusciae]|uniref:endolytic transglycosylase MltG n=1 Tax=Kyrpidia tusciae TaxID=33943 RepID=UPI0003176FC5|nr:endolytic transglycosylase MltG [Kyrpidia tusciae]
MRPLIRPAVKKALAAAVAGLIIAAGVGGWAWFRPTAAGAPVVVVIRPGSSVSDIADELQRAGLVRHASAFQVYVWGRRLAPQLKAGRYQFVPGTSIPTLAWAIAEGKVSPDTVRVTIPEGFTVEKIADLLQAQGVCSKAEFLREVDHGQFNGAILASIPKGAPMQHRLEGYLFPDTYFWEKHSPAHQVIQDMIDNLAAHIPQDWIRTAEARGESWHAVMTVASMVEREAKVPAERPQIAGVIYNRLRSRPPMPLQVDATVEYAVGYKPVLTYQDLEVDSPFNTYIHIGLPPGPIANPGLDSIRAAVFPATNDYYYYVAKGDGSGAHYFARTYAEHLQNEEKAQGSSP